MFFTINGTIWHIQYKNSNSSELRRSDNTISLGVTDRNTHTIYLSNALRGFMQRKVLIHEVCHAICMSYDVYLPIEQEEILCDFVATYGDEVFDIVEKLVFEHDIVWDSDERAFYEIIWNQEDMCWNVEDADGHKSEFEGCYGGTIEVNGNIFDNKELLESEE